MPYFSIAFIYIVLALLTVLAETKEQNMLVGFGWIACTGVLLITYALVQYTTRKQRMYQGKAIEKEGRTCR